jgi:hypothetical protein
MERVFSNIESPVFIALHMSDEPAKGVLNILNCFLVMNEVISRLSVND